MKKTKMLWTSLLLLGTIGGVAGMSTTLVSCSAGDSNQPEEVFDPLFPADTQCKVNFVSKYQPSPTIREKFSEADLNKIIEKQKKPIQDDIDNQNENSQYQYAGTYKSTFELRNNVFIITKEFTRLEKVAINPQKPKVLSIASVKREEKFEYTLVPNDKGEYLFSWVLDTISVYINNRPLNPIPEHLKNDFPKHFVSQESWDLKKLKDAIKQLYPEEK